MSKKTVEPKAKFAVGDWVLVGKLKKGQYIGNIGQVDIEDEDCWAEEGVYSHEYMINSLGFNQKMLTTMPDSEYFSSDGAHFKNIKAIKAPQWILAWNLTDEDPMLYFQSKKDATAFAKKHLLTNTKDVVEVSIYKVAQKLK